MSAPISISLALVASISAIATLGICALAHRLAFIAHLTSKPDGERRLHAHETPLMGGIAVLVPVLVLTLIYASIFPMSSMMHGAVIASIVMLIIGILDDRLTISPVWRLVGLSFICFGLFPFEPSFVLHSLDIWLFNTHLIVPLGPFAELITALIVIGFVNASNMTDGINGQLLGSALIWALLIIPYLAPQDTLPYVLLIGSAAIGFLFNLNGKLFSGSAGAYAISFLIALGSIAAYHQGAQGHAELPVLWFWLPVLDCLRLFIFRVMNHRHPFTGDRNHVHHMLLDIVPPWLALAIYLAFLALPGFLARIDEDWGTASLIFGIIAYAGFIIWRTPARKAATFKTHSPVSETVASGSAAE